MQFVQSAARMESMPHTLAHRHSECIHAVAAVLLLPLLIAFAGPGRAQSPEVPVSEVPATAQVAGEATNAEPDAEAAAEVAEEPPPRAEHIDLGKEVLPAPEDDATLLIGAEGDPVPANDEQATADAAPEDRAAEAAEGTEAADATVAVSAALSARRVILGTEIPPATATRLTWMPAESFGDISGSTPVLVVNGHQPGETLCLTAAVHGDELNGIEMIRRIIYSLDPEKLTGTVVGVPIVNLSAFRRQSRYLPDRRDLNRYFPGNPTGSAAARIAHSFFEQVVKHCDALVDLHTGSFFRTNLVQLRADLSNPAVAELSQSFGNIVVLNSEGHPNSLRAAAVRAGIPAVTMEAGEPLRLQTEIVEEGTRAIEALLHKKGMYNMLRFWARPAPVYYTSHWVRAERSGFLFSRVSLGRRVNRGEILGTITDPITNARTDIVSPYQGRILGMAIDQMVMPGFAAYHIGIQAADTAPLTEAGESEEPDMPDMPDEDSLEDDNRPEREGGPPTSPEAAEERMLDE